IESPTMALEEPAPDQAAPPRDLRETAGEAMAPGLSTPGQPAEPPTQVLGQSTHAETQDEDLDNLNRTMIKMPNCPNHPGEAATELCPLCRQAYCAKCVTEKDGKEMCLNCAKS
ncbi:MAG: hypothetical protein HY794_05710, partial [Desulfarculus sp.]|nr:hypothetical protein [Desulfarculus sp.]